MVVKRQLLLRLLLAVLLALGVVIGTDAPAGAAEPGPKWLDPRNGDQLSATSKVSLQVAAMPGADWYLYGFFENGRMVWESWASEHLKATTRYTLPDAGRQALAAAANGKKSWPVQLWARGYLHDHWSEASIITVTLTTKAGGASQNQLVDLMQGCVLPAIKEVGGPAGDITDIADLIEQGRYQEALQKLNSSPDAVAKQKILSAMQQARSCVGLWNEIVGPFPIIPSHPGGAAPPDQTGGGGGPRLPCVLPDGSQGEVNNTTGDCGPVQ
jgi:hypothetical protein